MAAACLKSSVGFLSLTLLFAFFPSGSQALTETIERKGKVAGASHVNLRSGPGVTHPPITILNNGEEVKVEKLEGNWYRVSLPDGLRGYVYAELIQFLPGKEATLETAAEVNLPTPTIEVTLEESTPQPQPDIDDHKPFYLEQPEESPPIPVEAPVEVAVQNAPTSLPESKNSPPEIFAVVPRMIETAVPVQKNQWRFWKILSWILAPSCLFILGWIFGGNYYLRRDRIERTKLRL